MSEVIVRKAETGEAYEVVRDGEVVKVIEMDEYDASNYAKVMGFTFVQPGEQ